MLSPTHDWWKPLGRQERSWLLVAFVWCLFLTAMMPLWYFYGKQNVPSTTYRVTPDDFKARVDEFVTEYGTGDELDNIPVVAPPPGSDVFLFGRQWQWYPVLQLQKGQTYHLHASSLDVQHGLSLQPVNLNFMVLPGYDYVITLTPTSSGNFFIVCNEYCFYGHHTMVGRIIVTD